MTDDVFINDDEIGYALVQFHNEELVRLSNVLRDEMKSLEDELELSDVDNEQDRIERQMDIISGVMGKVDEAVEATDRRIDYERQRRR